MFCLKMKKSCDNFGCYTPDRIWVKWDSSQLSFSPSFTSSQIIHGILEAGSLPPIYLSVIYAANLVEDRKVLWDNLLGLSARIDSPLIIICDFNCYRFDCEKAGGSSLPAGRLGELNSFIFYSSLQDLAYVGIFYTWYNQRIDLPIHIKLDRTLINNAFLELFQTAYYKVDPPSGSDHSTLILLTTHVKRTFSRFMFKDFWISMDGFWEEILLTFDRPNYARHIASFYNYLRYLKKAIRGKKLVLL
ncbi:hypothetical protein KFK09_021632 [Dendrobium nobile]|uniref:Endonuclease/exonuclease/phosphatase domain-containing protein n=1 Tax=Dendrobium nobile TaxID=94219 RepID=A0A8T3AQL5_DENNO|nr:hypothetical protein KFK09_021632 [Dendrobium nobile]